MCPRNSDVSYVTKDLLCDVYVSGQKDFSPPGPKSRRTNVVTTWFVLCHHLKTRKKQASTTPKSSEVSINKYVDIVFIPLVPFSLNTFT